MENFLFNLMEFTIELTVVSAARAIVVVGISIGFLYSSGLYKNRRAAIITPIVLAVAAGVIGPEDHASLRQWAYYVVPVALLAPPFVASLCYRKRLKEKGYKSA